MNSTKVRGLAESYIAAFGWPSRDRAADWLTTVLSTTIDAQVLADAARAERGLAVEREACAGVADAAAAEVREQEFFGPREGAEALRNVAATIRARGES